jgi:hypothetical protein
MIKLDSELLRFLRGEDSEQKSTTENSDRHNQPSTNDVSPDVSLCHKYKFPSKKIEGSPPTGFSTAKPGPVSMGKFRRGDWICAACKNHNYSFRQTCNRCCKQMEPEVDAVISSIESICPSTEMELDRVSQMYEPNSRGFTTQYGQPFYMFSSLEFNHRQVGDEQRLGLSYRSAEKVPWDSSSTREKIHADVDVPSTTDSNAGDKKSKNRELRLESVELETSFYEKQILKSLLPD